MIKLMRVETNRYATSVIQSMRVESNRYPTSVIQSKRARGCVLSSRSIFNTWIRVSDEDITRFLAVLIHTGIVHKPHIADYWSKDPAMASSFPPSCMRHGRFKAILAFYPLNSNQLFIPRGQPNQDPLHKLRPLEKGKHQILCFLHDILVHMHIHVCACVYVCVCVCVREREIERERERERERELLHG